jgi:protease-4
MLAFLRWLRATFLGALNLIARLAFMVIILLFVLVGIGMLMGDGLPDSMVLTLDMRSAMPDSVSSSSLSLTRPVTVLDTVLALDAAERDGRVKGAVIRLGSGSISVAEAEELGTAIKDFRKSGKFVYVHSQGFNSPGLGDYLMAASADQIWMQPLSPFMTAGTGGSEIFLRGLFDKIGAEPQIVKRAEYKSAADTFMEKSMTPADREQLTQLMKSVYGAAISGIAADRKLTEAAVIAAFEASPQLTEDAVRAKLADRTGFDDDTQAAALRRAGQGAKATKIGDYIKAVVRNGSVGRGPLIAVVKASGEIQDGSASGGFGTTSVIAGDDMAAAIREAARDAQVKAIIVRVDSPGGSVAASDQILDALRKAKARGKPVVISMASVAASGGYYISAYADHIVAQPGTITGSIGVLTGKVSIGKSLGMIGVTAEEVSVGKNTLMDSSLTPYTPEQLAAVNREADAIYGDFTRKVAQGRRLSLDKVQQIARGRVWSGADAKEQGLVDQLGGFWTATGEAKKLAKIGANTSVSFRQYPRPKGIVAAIDDLFDSSSSVAGAAQGLVTLMNTGAAKALLGAANDLPRSRVELRAIGIPDNL